MCPAPWNNDPLPPGAAVHLQPDAATHPPPPSGRQPTRPFPLTHPAVDAPICIECQALELTFFDPTCHGCRAQLLGASSDVAHVFSALRQWVPQVQQNVGFLVNEALRRGCHPDDRDCATDMTLLMYACKAGANGVGDVSAAAQAAQTLIDLGADLSLRCKWTNMSALHYSAYFDVSPVLTKLLMKSKGTDVDAICSEHENGTALHIAASNLSIEAARVLLSYGADRNLRDDLARTPADCIPEPEAFGVIPDATELVERMERLLAGHAEEMEAERLVMKPGLGVVSGRTALKALGLKVGDRVLVNSSKIGTLRYCGTTDFAPGLWAGVALDDPDGKNGGSVQGVVYFKCSPNHGVFVLAKKVAKVGSDYRETVKPQPRNNVVNRGKVDTRHVSSRLTDCLTLIEERSEVRVGDRVLVAHPMAHDGNATQQGTVRFVGSVDFVEEEGRWFGIELDQPVGRHDGTVQGVRYFAAADNCGIFVTEAKLTKVVDSQQVLGIGRESAMGTSKGRSSLSTKHRLSRSNSQIQDPKIAGTSTNPAPSPNLNSPGIRVSTSTFATANGRNLKASENSWQTVSATQFNKFKKKMPKKYLETGTSVICIHNKEMGIVKFVGRVDFSPGIWVGLELRQPNGRHDGFVEGKRYFTCKAKHGLIIRPNKISVHGINAENLLKPESEYPF